MKKLSNIGIIYAFLLCLLCLTIFSCIQKGNFSKVTIIDLEPVEKDSLDLNIIDCLDESNQKAIQVSNHTFDHIKDVETLQLLVKIRKNHQKIGFDFNNLTTKNLIIVPHLSNHFYLNPDSVKTKEDELNLLKTLARELDNQIVLLDHIYQKSNNIDFKTFAVRSKKTVQDNSTALVNITKDLQ